MKSAFHNKCVMYFSLYFCFRSARYVCAFAAKRSSSQFIYVCAQNKNTSISSAIHKSCVVCVCVCKQKLKIRNPDAESEYFSSHFANCKQKYFTGMCNVYYTWVAFKFFF